MIPEREPAPSRDRLIAAATALFRDRRGVSPGTFGDVAAALASLGTRG